MPRSPRSFEAVNPRHALSSTAAVLALGVLLLSAGACGPSAENHTPAPEPRAPPETPESASAGAGESMGHSNILEMEDITATSRVHYTIANGRVYPVSALLRR